MSESGRLSTAIGAGCSMSILGMDRFIEQIRLGFEEGDPNVHSKVIERKNVEIVQRLFEALSRNDFDAMIDEMSEEIEMEILGPPGGPMVGVCSGKTAVRQTLVQNFGMVDEQQPEILSVTAQGNTVVIVGRETGRFKPTGKTYNVSWVQIFTLQNDKAVRFREIVDMATLIQSATPN